MIKYRVLSLVFTLLIVVSSCSKQQDDDNAKPSVEIVKPTEGDTLYLGEIYRSFDATFKDDVGLSSYFIQISNPAIQADYRLIPLEGTSRDSILFLDQRIQNANIFDETDINVKHSFRLDSIGNFKNRGPFYIVEGVYQFKVVVLDLAGNRDSLSFDVNLKYPK